MKKQQQQTLPFQFFPRVAKAFVLELAKVTFGRIVHVQKTEIMQIYPWNCSTVDEKGDIYLNSEVRSSVVK